MSISIKEMKALNFNEQCKLLADHMPKGKMWVNSYNSNTNMGKLICSLALEYYRLGLVVEDEINEVDIDNTTRLIDNWETSVGIPSDLFDIDTLSIAERRTNIKYLFTNFWGVQTAEDFVRVAAFFGFEVTVESAVVNNTFALNFPIFFFSEKSVKYTIIVNTFQAETDKKYFALYFPYFFNDGGTNFLLRLFELLAPANVNVLLRSQESTIVPSNPSGALYFVDTEPDGYFEDIQTDFLFEDIDIEI